MHPLKSAARAACFALLALTVLACTSMPHGHGQRVATPPPPVLLVSLDGFRPDYLTLGITPNLARMTAQGVQAEWMTPSYPSLTFPNHYTIVTGKRPDHHGIVHNSMRDPELGKFSLGNREAVTDGRWWGGEPIWVTVEKAGLRAGTMFWPGSEAAIGGVQASHWKMFDAEMRIEERVDTLFDELEQGAQRHLESLARGQRRVACLGDGLQEPAGLALQTGGEQLILGAVIQIEHRLGDRRFLRNRVHGRLMEAVEGEDLDRGVEHLLLADGAWQPLTPSHFHHLPNLTRQ